MALNTTFRTPVQLTAEARAAADIVTDADPLSSFLPAVETRTLDFDLDNDSLGLPRAATFRSYDATAPYGREESVGSRKGKLPAASIKLPLGEWQQLQLQQASNDEIGAALERKARQNAQSIAIRAIIAKGEAIATGKVTLNENNLVAEIDFGRNAALAITTANAWSNHTLGTPLDDLIGAQETRQGLGLAPLPGFVTSTQVLTWLATNDQIIAQVMRDADSGLTRVSIDDVLSLLASYGFSQATVYDKVYKDYDGNTVRPIDDNQFVLVPSRNDVVIDGGPLGSTLWGVPGEALDRKYGIPQDEQAGILAAALDRDDPVGMDVLDSSIFLPVLQDPDQTMQIVVGA